ncbi:hypothetical protein [Paraburkholderia caballeronis]|uniref:Uncharacterized protein n=1 Tax=Paraburkholderia caballeronis TaxID=416943 RepID=A0A1H7F1T1_9BURK|nr:hypothetical protein [Paraburkholderia caballeronis]PXW14584.1 hypothetical protein C7403_12822 [Paraburkholderia caballeronis]PXW93329.1 hypothetical protein C7407_12822 [Paraburkholderia caballeronis]RAJ87233.1 hypothetical protein C7409_12822 [Paraburkholderia caballeronis]TDV04984.1 hypothetical protein C7408_12921 [Paraburkholderia caballeronis]TDV08152.1 hypothetical protein C7406_13121 [Paraburkholderia caballeronis]
MLKRPILLFALPVVLCITLSACGGDDTVAASSNAQQDSGVTNSAPSGLRSAP